MADGIEMRSLRTFAFWSLNEEGSCSSRSSFYVKGHVTLADSNNLVYRRQTWKDDNIPAA